MTATTIRAGPVECRPVNYTPICHTFNTLVGAAGDV
jgi:hypothetical protein